MLAALLGSFALGAGVSACGGAHKAATTPSIAAHTKTHASDTVSTGTTSTPTTGSATSPAVGDTTTAGSSTTASGSTGTGSGSGSSGGAGLGGSTTSTTTTTTTTTTSCTGRDCQNGSPTVPGSVPPVDGKCRSGYVYVAAQDGGPALCIPLQTSTTPATATQ